jgi:uncharacterized membrane protein
MENNDIISFIAPIIAILIGIYVKNSNHEYDSFMKKKWFYLVIGGILMILYDLYKYLK